MTEAWADLIKTLTEEAENGALLSVAWITDKGGRNRRFGHVGYADGRELLTDSLITLRQPKALDRELN